jgi:pyruvate formate lyase activating enzyme
MKAVTPQDSPLSQAGENPGGYVHSTIPSGSVDGPGIRFVLFVSGCPLRCLYCHNPDTWDLKSGTWRSVNDVVAEIGKYAGFLKCTGGLTVSGGGPLMQAKFVHEVMRRCKREYGLHTALDTTGLLSKHLPDAWFDAVDMVLLDIKHIDPEKHKLLTSVPLQPVLDFARRLARMSKPVWIRHVLVPGYTDDYDDVEKLADFVAGLKNVERVEVLPFHKMGEYKWKELGFQYELGETPAPTEETVERVRHQFESRGLLAVA